MAITTSKPSIAKSFNCIICDQKILRIEAHITEIATSECAKCYAPLLKEMGSLYDTDDSRQRHKYMLEGLEKRALEY